MSKQFSQTVASLLSPSPNLTLSTPPSSPPPTPPIEQVASTAPTSSPPAASTPKIATTSTAPAAADKSVPYPSEPSFDFIPRLLHNPATSVRGKVVIFNTLTNAFHLCNLGPCSSLRSVVLTSPKQRIHSMPIKKFDGKVDLRDAGVRAGEGQVDDVVKELPAKVVLMRMMGLYHTLYIVRSVDNMEDGEVRK